MFKEKALAFMEAHPKATRVGLDVVTAVAGGTGLAAVAGGGLVASADDSTTTVADTLVTAATNSWSDAVEKVVPFIGAVMRFAKG